MAKNDTNITMVRGDTLALGIELYDDDGELLTDDLTGAYFSCKADSDDEEYVFQKSLSDGISKRSTGVYSVRVAPEDTEDLEAGVYYYDLEIQISSDVYTPIKGKLTLETDITREA